MRRHLAALGPHTSHLDRNEDLEVSDWEETPVLLTFKSSKEPTLFKLEVEGFVIWTHISGATLVLGKAPNILSFVVQGQSP